MSRASVQLVPLRKPKKPSVLELRVGREKGQKIKLKRKEGPE